MMMMMKCTIYNIREMLGSISAAAFGNQVTREPVLVEPNAELLEKGKRMDLLVLGGSNVQQVTLIDVACVNTDTPSRIATPVKDVIKQWERMKVQKYEDSCFKRRARLVPFVVTTDGGFGKEADAYLQLASPSYSAKTNKSYS
eukprot:Selendium_serpulae@DN6519_c1_g1_i12.p1